MFKLALNIMAQGLTKEYLDQALDKLASKDDFAKLESEMVRKDDLEQLKQEIRNDFSDLQSSVDRYLKRTETWHDEFEVLAARFKQVVNLLDQRGVLKEEETHLT